MKIMTINTGWQSTQQWIPDDARADAAYKALTEAMESYERYDNDKEKTVTIDVGDGRATYRIATLVAVSLDECTGAETTIIEREVWKRALDAKIAARLAPAVT